MLLATAQNFTVYVLQLCFHLNSTLSKSFIQHCFVSQDLLHKLHQECGQAF